MQDIKELERHIDDLCQHANKLSKKLELSMRDNLQLRKKIDDMTNLIEESLEMLEDSEKK